MLKYPSSAAIFLASALMSSFVTADHHAHEANAELHAAIVAFDRAYATNDVDLYFSLYADDATVYVGGGERVDMVAYRKMWVELMGAGGGVERNDMSDLKVQVMPGGEVAIATSFINNRTRAADGSKTTSRAFETDVWQKINGQWKIVSLHYSDATKGDG
jgi:ketosteroid isomerase-like protein